jgi:hypothetical protein
MKDFSNSGRLFATKNFNPSTNSGLMLSEVEALKTKKMAKKTRKAKKAKKRRR